MASVTTPAVPGGINLKDSVQRRAVERGFLSWFWAQHASELTRQVLLEVHATREEDRYYAIERILDALCDEYKQQHTKKKKSRGKAPPWGRVNWIQSRTFSTAELRRHPVGKKRPSSDRIAKARDDVREVIDHCDTIITLFGTTYKQDSGHYCAVLYEKKTHTLYLWDSMASLEPAFVRAAKLIFEHPLQGAPVDVDVHVDAKTPGGRRPITIVRQDIACREAHEEKHLVPQPTGGFSINTASWVQKALELKLINKEEWLELRSYGTEAQNHFCYGWSLWTLQLVLSGKNVCKVFETLFYKKHLDPLNVIKRYLFALVHCQKLSELQLRARINALEPQGFEGFWEKHFLCIHGLDAEQRIALRKGTAPSSKPLRYIYNCSAPPKAKDLATLKGCLLYSVKA